MCGICGVLRPDGRRRDDHAVVDRVNDAQRHRGPDAADRWSAPRLTLGQTRLAIVDLTGAGRQPFTSADGRVTVVFNGEIYNHEELRRRHRLDVPARCDGAILPALWARLGPAMFRELRGMYAIAVHDATRGTLTLARDPFGIKPLYFTTTSDGGVAFASEARPLLDLAPAPALDRAALAQYLRFGSLGRDQSPFTGVHAVPANSWVQWDERLTRRTGTVHDDLLRDLPPAGAAELRAAFVDSVSQHLLADVPVALLLSSGIDSGAIAWAAAQRDVSLVCVTVDLGAEMGEWDEAARVARRFGHRHEVVSTSPDESDVRRYLAAMQRPSVDGLNVFVVNRAIADLGLKVALSGTGGDEMLAGYPAFRRLRRLGLLRATDRVGLARPLAAVLAGRNRKLAELVGPGGPRDAAGLGALTRRVLLDAEVGRLAPWTEAPAGTTGDDRSALALSRYEIEHYLGGTLLPDADAFSMASSVELRVPFVDVPFARQALAVDPVRGVGKRGFAEALGDSELIDVVRRPKRCFHLPMDGWMRRGLLAGWVRDAERRDAPVREILAGGAVDAVIAGWRGGYANWPAAWAVVALDGWLRTLDPALVRLEPARRPDLVAA